MAVKEKIIEIHTLPDGRLNTRDAATYLGIAEKTLAMWRCTGVGPQYIKLGRVFYFQADLDAWVQRAERASSTTEARRQKAGI